MTQHDQRSHAKDVLATSFETLSCQLAAPHVLLVSLNRPSVGNAINTQMGRDLLRLWTMLTEDAEDIRCIVLAGTGNRIFCEFELRGFWDLDANGAKRKTCFQSIVDYINFEYIN